MERTRILWGAVAAAVLAVAVDALYLSLLAAEGDLGNAVAVGFAAALAAAAAVLGYAARPVPYRGALLAGAAVVLGAWTILGAASIGLFLLPAAVLASFAAVRAPRPR